MLRLSLAVVFASIAAAAPAQVPAGGEFRVNTYTTDSQGSSGAAMDASGGFTVAWTSHGQDGVAGGIFAQRYAPDGSRAGGEFLVNTTTTDGEALPSVACGPGGNFAVVWHGTGDPGFDIWGQRHGRDGSRRGAEFRVNSFTAGNEYRPDVAALAGGGFVVVWSSHGQYGGQNRIMARRFDAFGIPVGTELQVSGSTAGLFTNFPVVAAGGDGRFVVAWEQGGTGLAGIAARLYDASGTPAGPQFFVELTPRSGDSWPDVAMRDDGGFVVVWQTGDDGSTYGIHGRTFSPAGAPSGGEFRANQETLGPQRFPRVAMGFLGDFVVAWSSRVAVGGSFEVVARRFTAGVTPRGGDFAVNTFTSDDQWVDDVSSDGVGNFVVSWTGLNQDGSDAGVYAQRFGGLVPSALLVDTAASQSDGNGVLEPGETVDVRPAWRNVNGAAQAFSGTLSGFAGPAGATYTLTDGAAGYGTVPDGATGACSDCYGISLSAPSPRPAWHWDAWAVESLAPDAQGQRMFWPLHIGDTFSDVPRSNPFYRFVETLVHNHVVLGCASAQYCPGSPTTREQMAVFVLVARDRAGDPPPPCTTPLFTDVPASSGFCRWIEELARSGVVAGCGGGAYCPSQPVSREQMAVFVLRTLDGALDPPACTTPMFADVPASSPFCRWIEELARRGVVAGCGGGNYCPQAPVARDQMAVFISATFGLTLYGP